MPNRRIRKKWLKRKAQAIMHGPQGAGIQAGMCDLARDCLAKMGGTAEWCQVQVLDKYGQVIAGCTAT